MTARQIIQEIEALPPEEKREVLASLQNRLKEETAIYGAAKSAVHYLDHDEALRVADRIFTERAELFQKLAQ